MKILIGLLLLALVFGFAAVLEAPIISALQFATDCDSNGKGFDPECGFPWLTYTQMRTAMMYLEFYSF
ncbi:MAG: hypothetical protein KKF48_05305 [Nanoarchaeota archaeon]|nr:hypothetical protein [Nanoarchaeota archaeon]MBU1028436.1 hypothetical protein [Nanoarchaeota archaeon]